MQIRGGSFFRTFSGGAYSKKSRIGDYPRNLNPLFITPKIREGAYSENFVVEAYS